MIYKKFDKTGYEIKGYDYLSMRLLRLISIPIARNLSKVSYPPERIVVISLCLSMLSSFLFTFGQRYLTLSAGLILFLSWLLDYVDGDLARIQKRVTYLGDWLDSMAGKLKDIIIFPCICLGVYRQIGQVYTLLLGFVVFGGIYFSWMMQSKTKSMRLNKGLSIKTEDKPAEIRKGLLGTILHETTSGSDLVFYFIILGAIFNQMSLALLLSAIYMCLYAIFTAYVTHKTVTELDRIK